jgi:hypothetical protein
MSIPHFLNYLKPGQLARFLWAVVLQQMRHMDRLLGEVKRKGATTFEITETVFGLRFSAK